MVCPCTGLKLHTGSGQRLKSSGSQLLIPGLFQYNMTQQGLILFRGKKMVKQPDIPLYLKTVTVSSLCHRQLINARFENTLSEVTNAKFELIWFFFLTLIHQVTVIMISLCRHSSTAFNRDICILHTTGHCLTGDWQRWRSDNESRQTVEKKKKFSFKAWRQQRFQLYIQYWNRRIRPRLEHQPIRRY